MDIDTTYAWTPVLAVALVGALAGAAFYLKPPLESARPDDPSHIGHEPLDSGAIVTRLWQDPLHVIQEQLHGGSQPPNTNNVPNVVDFALAVAHQPTVHQLRIAAIMPSMPYAYDRETRRRQRHALVSTLTEARYVPVNENHLGYFRALPLHAPDKQEGPSEQVLVGYEYYEPGLDLPKSAPWESILVLWLKADDFATYPLHQISALLAAIDSRTEYTTDPVTVVLGPDGSGDLHQMLAEPQDAPHEVHNYLGLLHRLLHAAPSPSEVNIPVELLPKPWLTPFSTTTSLPTKRNLLELTNRRRADLVLISPRATLPLDVLACESHDQICRHNHRIPPNDAAATLLAEQRVTARLGIKQFRSTVSRDDVVLQTILAELLLRGACTPDTRNPTVIVISEQDTAYGRLLDQVADAYRADDAIASCDFHVEAYGYLRGVDGETPPKSPDRSLAIPRRSPDRPSSDQYARPVFRLPLLFGAPAEPSHGVHQLDYMRRLAERVVQFRNRDSRVAAVGVLGVDVYDKNLIMQALREQLSGTTFFTTDLDALLLSPDANRWTSNLIVGAAHGLAREPCGPPEFRDSYQTAYFHAVSLALKANAPHQLPPAPPPRLFEIGRVHAVDITPRDAAGGFACFATSESKLPRTPYGAIFGLLLPALGLALYGLLRWWHLSTGPSIIRRRYNRIVAVGGLLTVFLAWIAALYYHAGEPWPLLERISSVPMIIYGYTTVSIALAILILARGRSLAAWHHVAESANGLKDEAALERIVRRPTLRWIVSMRRRLIWITHRPSAGGTTAAWRYSGLLPPDPLVSTWMHSIANDNQKFEYSIKSVLLQFRLKATNVARIMRILTRVGVALVLSMIFFGRVSEEQPLLSHWHVHIQRLDLMLGVAVYIAVFYCSDTVNMWKAVVRALGHYDLTQWKARDSDSLRNDLAIRVRRSMDALVRCTEFVEPVIVMPLVLMTMLVLIRSTLFEGWNWTGELIWFHVAFVAYIFGSAFLFQRQASRTKAGLIERLDEERFRVSYHERRQIEMEMKRIENNREGAFVPWVQHPVLQSLAVPVGGIIIIAALEAWLLP